MKVKAIITDLDSTLLHTDKTISEYTCSILRQCRDRGMLLMAATARPERAVLTYQEQIHFDAMTTLNGARILLSHGTVENGIAPRSVEAVLQNVIGIPGVILSLETAEGIFSNVPIPEWNAMVYEEFPALPTESAVYKILLSNGGRDIQPEVEKSLTPDTYMTVAEGWLIQIMSAAASKWNGVRAMLEAAGTSPEEAVYFGDDNDDLESIRNCGTGVAVSNAIDRVLEVADHVTESNDRDGVARYIKRYLLSEN